MRVGTVALKNRTGCKTSIPNPSENSGIIEQEMKGSTLAHVRASDNNQSAAPVKVWATAGAVAIDHSSPKSPIATTRENDQQDKIF
jgi:hypothetical protein